jgi:hypothetical protein
MKAIKENQQQENPEREKNTVKGVRANTEQNRITRVKPAKEL